MILLKDKGFYWIRSDFYRISKTIGQYDEGGWSKATFDLIGSDAIYYAHYFEVLKEIDDYDKSNQPPLLEDNP